MTINITTDLQEHELQELLNVKDKEIRLLKESNKILATGILTWSQRADMNYYVRKLGKMSNEDYRGIWCELYRELTYKYSLHLAARGLPPYIQHIKENEWHFVIKSFAAMCEERGFSCAKILNKKLKKRRMTYKQLKELNNHKEELTN